MSEVCRSFRNKGRCKYGEDCKYEHTEGEPIPPPPRGSCHNFTGTGECKFAERCRFMHGDNDARFDETGAFIKQARRGDDQPRRTREPRVPRDPDAPVVKIDEDCKNWLAGRCRFADNCRRNHVGDVAQDNIVKRKRKRRRKKSSTQQEEGDASQGNASQGTEEKKAPKKKRERKPRVPRDPDAPIEQIDEECRNYQAGKCRYGESCRRIHTGNVEQLPVIKIDEICNNFQTGNCRFGEMCRRQHTTVQA